MAGAGRGVLYKCDVATRLDDADRRGILDPGAAPFERTRFAPAADLAAVVDWHWLVRWDLRGQPAYASAVLPYPSANLAVGTARAGLHGVCTRRFVATLGGAGWTLGTKLKPGACRALVDRPAHQLTDRVLAIDELFGPRGARFVRESDEAGRVADVERLLAGATGFLRDQLRPTPEIAAAVALVELAQRDRTILRVDALAARAGRSVRAVERAFRDHVGVAPKWVLCRFRIHEATTRAAAGERLDWAALAVELGYADQAHLIREFKAQVGTTPEHYAARQRPR